jgi:hypothetical protein
MSSYANGAWTHENNCPTCWVTRVSQGFKLPETTGEECASCTEAAALAVFYASAEYVAWQSTIPAGMNMEQMSAWGTANPPPVFTRQVD